MDSSQRFVEEVSKLHIATKGICNFFGELGMFISQDRGFPSYYTIRGREVEDIPENLPLEKRVFPVINKYPKDEAQAIKSCEKLGRKLFSVPKDHSIKVLDRDFMICGSTLPILVQYEISDTKDHHENVSLYCKQMSLHRLFMGTLYHLVIGEKYPAYFSEESIFEPGVPGPTLREAYHKDSQLLSNKSVLDEIAKLSVVSYFLSLYDMDNDTNMIVTRDKQLRVIDFDKAFWDTIPHPSTKLVNPFTYEIIGPGKETTLYDVPDEKLMRKYGTELPDLINLEMGKVYENIRDNIGMFHSILDIMCHVEYYNLQAQELYGAKDVKDYFIKRTEEFRIASRGYEPDSIRRLM